MKHTPGPWRVKEGTYFRNPDEGNNELVSYLWVGAGRIGDEMPVLSKHLVENEANSRLIAAAPDLLQTLKDLIAYAEVHGDMDDVLDSCGVHNAIAKAEGK